jgi:hypothetical protein
MQLILQESKVLAQIPLATGKSELDMLASYFEISNPIANPSLQGDYEQI